MTVERIGAAQLDHVFVTEFGLLQFAPELQVALEELEAVETVVRDDRLTQRVQSREEPAAPRQLLVGHALEADAVAELLFIRLYHTAVQHERVDGIGRERIEADVVTLVGLPEAGKDFGGETTVGTRRGGKEGRKREEQE